MNPIHPGNFECFMDEYAKQLRASVETSPQDYAWSVADFDSVLARMRSAIERGSFNKDSTAFKRTCKALGIKHTYAAIREFVS